MTESHNQPEPIGFELLAAIAQLGRELGGQIDQLSADMRAGVAQIRADVAGVKADLAYLEAHSRDQAAAITRHAADPGAHGRAAA